MSNVTWFPTHRAKLVNADNTWRVYLWHPRSLKHLCYGEFTDENTARAYQQKCEGMKSFNP